MIAQQQLDRDHAAVLGARRLFAIDPSSIWARDARTILETQ